jgi:hypothetical protein
MTPFNCTRCAQAVFFENSRCESCLALLGFVPEQRRMVSFEPEEGTDLWLGLGLQTALRRRPCFNHSTHGVCNWTVPETAAPQALCTSCELTQVLPDLSDPLNLERWGRIEQAKRRLVYTLMDLGLTPEPKRSADDLLGLSFRFEASQGGLAPVLTGHDQGVITLNVAEADDVHREAVRVAFNEPLRTLLGHLRHEVSHYLQYRWIDNTPAVTACRAVFGDERTDYAQALQQYHADGPAPGWEQAYISNYASAHPWEDWAETCAHFLLVIDAVQTAAAWGLRLKGPTEAAPPLAGAEDLPSAEDLVVAHWLPVAQFLNAMNRSLGLRDSYPFLMPNAVLTKLGTVQTLLANAASQHRARGNAPPSVPAPVPAADAAQPLNPPSGQMQGQPTA